MPSYVLTFYTEEEVTPVYLARRVAEACASYYALRPGEAVEEPRTGARFEIEQVARELAEFSESLRATFKRNT